MKTFILKTAAIIAISGALAACSESESKTAGPPAMPPMPVSIVEVKAEKVPITNDLPGRIAPTRIAEVRPRVTGIVLERVFEQGSIVKQGDVLYRIDPAVFAVQVASSEATLQRAKALQLQAQQAAKRQAELHERKIASVQQRDDAVALEAQADADVALAEAGLAAANLNLQYANVTAPISGRIGRALITEGALVSSSDILASIRQLDPVYVDFTQSAGDLMALRQALADGSIDSPAPGEAAIRMLFDNGSEYAERGRLLFSEASVDTTTGQVTLRAELPNPKGDLLPGMYMRVLIEQGVEPNAIAVPGQAVQRDAGGQSQVYIATADNKAELRNVTVGRTIDQRVVITQGLQPGDRVIVEGFQKLRPGTDVAAETWSPAGTAKAVDAAAGNTAG